MFNLKEFIRDVPDFPKEGIVFKDITPLLQNEAAYHEAVARLADFVMVTGADVVIGPESRGFIFGCPVAYAASKPFVPVRKPGKLPCQVIEAHYALEYGTDKLEMHLDAIKPGMKVAIVDDLLATGGTVEAIIKMVKALGGEVVAVACLIELKDLNGRQRLEVPNFCSLITY